MILINCMHYYFISDFPLVGECGACGCTRLKMCLVSHVWLVVHVLIQLFASLSLFRPLTEGLDLGWDLELRGQPQTHTREVTSCPEPGGKRGRNFSDFSPFWSSHLG